MCDGWGSGQRMMRSERKSTGRMPPTTIWHFGIEVPCPQIPGRYTEGQVMQPRRILLCGLLFLAAPLCVLSQESGSRFEALNQALGLSDAQMSQLQQRSKGLAATGMLDDSQRAKLAEIRKVLDRWDAAAFAVELGLITNEQWPGGCLCASRVRGNPYSTELGITDAQAQQIERILESVNAKERREPVLAVFDEAQRAKLAAFEAGMQRAREAIQLGLIPRVPKGECLCH